MSIKAFRWAKAEVIARAERAGDAPWSVLATTEAFVLVMLADHFNEDWRRAWPSQATLAKETGMSTKSVTRAVEKLRVHGLVETESWFLAESEQRLSMRYCLPRYRTESRPVDGGRVWAYTAYSEDGIPGDSMHVPGTNIWVDTTEFPI